MNCCPPPGHGISHVIILLKSAVCAATATASRKETEKEKK